MRRDPSARVRAFVARINRGDVEGLFELMSTDHLFIDSIGDRVRGRDAMRRAWIGYFRLVPDYRISMKETFVRGDTVVLTGIAEGSYVPPEGEAPAGRWRTPAAWRAVVRGGQVAEWQVYADNEPIRRLMREASARGKRTRGTRPAAARVSRGAAHLRQG